VSIAAGSAVTASVGADILARGGSAADAAAAMTLASCVAETVFTGIGGGGFAIYHDAASGSTTCVDFYVTVPGLGGQRSVPSREIAIDFGGQLVPYAVGPSTVAVPGVPAGVAHLHRRWGRLPWRDVVQPAIDHAERGVAFAPVHAKVLATVAAAMLINEGAAVYGDPAGGLLPGGGLLFHPGLDAALRILADEGHEAFYTGSVAEAMLESIGDQGDLGPADLAAYRVRESRPRAVEFAGTRVLARGDDLDDLLGALAALAPSDNDAEMAELMVVVLRGHPRRGDTTAAVVADADGSACAVTTSLGLSSGVWLAGLGVHLNSMMGEGELIRGTETPGRRLGSMMSPLIAVDGRGPVLVAGAAGGSRIRSALLQVLVNVLCRGMSAADAVGAPRLNPVPGKVHVEPGMSEAVLARLETIGEVARWPALESYFGGVAAISLDGPGADPRRGGDVWALRDVS
jgi:gamma-glutamyltranspeptidase/glutathione hydrolase